MINPEFINEQGGILPSGGVEIRHQRADEVLTESTRLTPQCASCHFHPSSGRGNYCSSLL